MTSPQHKPAPDPLASPRRRGWGLWGGAAVCAAAAVVLLLPAGGSDEEASSLTPATPLTEASTTPTPLPAPASSPGVPDEPEAPPAPPAPAATPSAPASPQTGTDADLEADVVTEQRWRTVATGFATDFTTAGPDAADWQRRVSRWTTEQLAEQYQLVAHERIPAGRLLTLEPDAIGEYIVEFTARYDTGLVITGRAVSDGTSWRIAAAEPG